MRFRATGFAFLTLTVAAAAFRPATPYTYRIQPRRAGRHPPAAPPRPPSRLHARTSTPPDLPDYLVTDSDGLEERPNVLDVLINPRDVLALSLLGFGALISWRNIAGNYDGSYVTLEQWAVLLGAANAVAAGAQVVTGYNIRRHDRRGIVDDTRVNLMGGAYSLAASWLALRASRGRPGWLTIPAVDHVMAPLAILVFVYSLAAPVATLVGPDEWFDGAPPLTEIELVRVRGLVAIGVVACVFVPDALAFCIGGEAWWARVTDVYPAQDTLESTTALAALFATEASMIAHRCGKAGCARFRDIVPAFVGTQPPKPACDQPSLTLALHKHTTHSHRCRRLGDGGTLRHCPELAGDRYFLFFVL